MNRYVADTQALIKFMQNKKVINDSSQTAFEDAENGTAIIIIPAIVMTEAMYLFERNRISHSIFDIETLFSSDNYQFEPLNFGIIKTASEITDIPELHDRLIAATARYLDIPLITNDPEIISSSFVTVLN